MQKISIIITVYNAEKYLDKCIESAVKQTYENIEVIIVNDGSTDNSKNIINKYKENYPNIINSFEISNSGVANARNYGIEKASGNYFCFIDADDYIDVNLLQNLVPYLSEGSIDIIKYKMKIIDNTYIEKIDGPIFNKVKGEDAFNMLCFKDTMIDTPCLYLFNTKYYKDNKFKFTKNTYHEDFGLIPLIILKADSVISADVDGYNYVQASNSIIRENNYEKTLKKANDLIIHYDNMINYIKKIDLKSETKNNVRITSQIID